MKDGLRWIPEVLTACTGPVYLTFGAMGSMPRVPALGTLNRGTKVVRYARVGDRVGEWTGDCRDGHQRDRPDRGIRRSAIQHCPLIYRMLGRIRAGRRALATADHRAVVFLPHSTGGPAVVRAMAAR